MKAKQTRMQQIHEHRRIQVYGAEEEKRQIKQQYYNDCDNLVHWQKKREEGQKRRDQAETVQCNDLFVQKCNEARAEEVAKRELAKRVAQENLMLSANKRRIIVQDDVTEAMRQQDHIINAKTTYSTMIR